MHCDYVGCTPLSLLLPSLFSRPCLPSAKIATATQNMSREGVMVSRTLSPGFRDEAFKNWATLETREWNWALVITASSTTCKEIIKIFLLHLLVVFSLFLLTKFPIQSKHNSPSLIIINLLIIYELLTVIDNPRNLDPANLDPSKFTRPTVVNNSYWNGRGQDGRLPDHVLLF